MSTLEEVEAKIIELLRDAQIDSFILLGKGGGEEKIVRISGKEELIIETLTEAMKDNPKLRRVICNTMERLILSTLKDTLSKAKELTGI